MRCTVKCKPIEWAGLGRCVSIKIQIPKIATTRGRLGNQERGRDSLDLWVIDR